MMADQFGSVNAWMPSTNEDVLAWSGFKGIDGGK